MRAAAALLALALAGGCQGTMGAYSSHSRNRQLSKDAAEYNKLIRWQEWDRASGYLKPEDEAGFRERMRDEEETLRVSDFEITDTAVDPDARSATVRVFYRYYRVPSVTERKASFRQRWIWSEEGNRWKVDAPLAFLRHCGADGSSGNARADAAQE